MQNSAYGAYPPATGYYTQPPAAPTATSAPTTVIPSYGTSNVYGGSYQTPAPPSTDGYTSYQTSQPSTYDTKSQQPSYYTQAQQPAPSAGGPPPPAGQPQAPPPPPAAPAYGSNTDSYGANNYYQSQPGAPQPPPAAAGQAQPPAPQGYGGYSSSAPPPPGPNAPPVGWRNMPQSNYNDPNVPPNGFGYGNGMTRGMPPNGPPGNFRGAPVGGGRNSGPGFKGAPAPPPPQQQRNAGPPGPPPGQGPRGFMPSNDAENDTIFISGLPTDVTEEQIASYFGSIGVIKSDKSNKHKIWIYHDKVTGEGKGEATLTYEDPHTAKSAINWFHGKELPNTQKILKVEFAQRRTPVGGDFKGGRGRGGGGGGRGGRGSGGGGGGGGRGDSVFIRQGDWRCPSCNNNNFSWRNECNRCKVPKPADVGPPPGLSGGDHRRPSGPPMDRRDDDFGNPKGRRPPRHPMPGNPRMRGGMPMVRGFGPRGNGGPVRGPPMGDDRRHRPY